MRKQYKLYKHILVPLDGSELAELALPDAFALARLSQAQVTVLQVIVPIAHHLDPDVDDPDFIEEQGKKYEALARQYLNSVCERMGCENITVHTEAKMGSPAETIIDYTHQEPIDLIIMATHGHSGFKRWAFGSVADEVLRGVDIPVLLIRAQPNA